MLAISEPELPRLASTRTGGKPSAPRIASISRSGTSAPITRSNSLRDSSIVVWRLASRIDVHHARENFAAGHLLNQFGAAARSQLRHFRIGAALEAVRGFACAGPALSRCGEWKSDRTTRDSSSMLRVAELISLSAPPITPAMATARDASAITHISFASARSTPSSVRIFSPARARRTTMRCSASKVEIEGVQRLAEFEHDVVGGVHHVVDRILAERFQALPQPVGRRPHLHAAQHARRVAAAQLGSFDFHARGARQTFSPIPSASDCNRLARQAVKRRHLARHAVVAQAIGAIGGEFGVEQRPGGSFLERIDATPASERRARSSSRRGRTSTNSFSQS